MQDKTNKVQLDYPLELELAQVYIPFQDYEQIYTLQEALKKGTIFPKLYRPYRRKR